MSLSSDRCRRRGRTTITDLSLEGVEDCGRRPCAPESNRRRTGPRHAWGVGSKAGICEFPIAAPCHRIASGQRSQRARATCQGRSGYDFLGPRGCVDVRGGCDIGGSIVQRWRHLPVDSQLCPALNRRSAPYHDLSSGRWIEACHLQESAPQRPNAV